MTETIGRLDTHERSVVNDIAAAIIAPRRPDDGRGYGPLLDRLTRHWGLDSDTVLYIGEMIAATRETHSRDIVTALAVRSPNAFPKRLRRYVRRFQAHFKEWAELERREYRREHLAMMRDHFGPDPDLFDD